MTDSGVPDTLAAELMAELVIDRSIKEEGVLAPIVDQFSEALQREYATSFDTADRLNKLVLAAWALAPNEGDAASLRPVANRLMFRAIHAFGGVVVLARRGLETEAQTLARGIYECAFWMGCFHIWGDIALEAFRRDNAVSYASFEKSKLAVVPNPEEEVRLTAELKALRKIGVPSPAELAKGAAMLHSYVHYKYLCGMAAHSSLSSIGKYLTFDEHGRPGHEFNFEGKAIPLTLGHACFALLEAFSRFTFISQAPGDIDAMREIAVELNTLFGLDGDEAEPENS